MDLQGPELATLRDVGARAKNPPPRRPPVATKYVYTEWDKIRGSGDQDMDLPKEWTIVIQKTILRRMSHTNRVRCFSLLTPERIVWKNDALKPSWSLDCHTAFAGRARAGGDLHMYADYRYLVEKRILRSPAEFDSRMKAPPGTRKPCSNLFLSCADNLQKATFETRWKFLKTKILRLHTLLSGFTPSLNTGQL